MNRKEFFRKIGAISLITVVTPSVLLADRVIIEPIIETPNKFVPYEGLTREQIREVVEYVFNKPMAPPERRIKFITKSEEAVKSFNRLFKEEVNKGWPIQ